MDILDPFWFESDKAKRAVTDTPGDVGWILAADEFGRTDEGDPATSQLMLWREEQRAVGELLRQDGDEPCCTVSTPLWLSTKNASRGSSIRLRPSSKARR